MGKEETVNVCSGGWQLVAATLSPRLPWKHYDDNDDGYNDDDGGGGRGWERKRMINT